MRLSKTVPHRRFLPALLVLVLLATACSGGSKDPAPAPDVAPAAQQLGREIGETFLLLLDDTKAMLALNLPVEQLRPALGMLRDDYRVRFANLGCLSEAMEFNDRSQVQDIAAALVLARGGMDRPWLEQAKTRYAADAEMPGLLAGIETLRLYAFLDELARLRPGETILCN